MTFHPPPSKRERQLEAMRKLLASEEYAHDVSATTWEPRDECSCERRWRQDDDEDLRARGLTDD